MFYQQLWLDNQDIIQKIQEMNFIQEMLSGELSDERFFYYIEQDIHYLYDYIRATSLLVVHSENEFQLKFFHQQSVNALLELDSIHQRYTSQENYSAKNTHTPAYLNYKNFILALTSTKPVAVAFVGMLACPWLYIYLGETYKNYSFINNKYQYWFEANSILEFQNWLKEAQELVEYFANTYPNYQQIMKNSFREALFMEYHFWQDAYDLKKQ